MLRFSLSIGKRDAIKTGTATVQAPSQSHLTCFDPPRAEPG
jgi:hypothetical protein